MKNDNCSSGTIFEAKYVKYDRVCRLNLFNYSFVIIRIILLKKKKNNINFKFLTQRNLLNILIILTQFVKVP